jgi:hypothetical protein
MKNLPARFTNIKNAGRHSRTCRLFTATPEHIKMKILRNYLKIRSHRHPGGSQGPALPGMDETDQARFMETKTVFAS